MSLTAAERETIIAFDDSGASASVVTYSRSVLRKLKSNPSAVVVREGVFEGTAYGHFIIPKELVTFRVKRRPKPMSELERSAQQARMATARAARGQA